MDIVRVTCPSLLSIGGLITTMIFGFWCQSFVFDGKDHEFTFDGVNYNFQVPDLRFSPWYRQRTTIQDIERDGWTFTVTTRDECVTWGSDEDSKWIFVRAITVITPIIGGIFAIMLCMMQICPPCTPIVRKSWHCMGVTFILVLTLFQGLGFLIYRSNACEENPFVRYLVNTIEDLAEKRGVQTDIPAFDLDSGILWENECTWDKGSSANVAAVVFWFLAGAVMLALGAPAPDDDNGDEDPSPAPQESDDEKEEVEKPEQPAAEEDADGEETAEKA